MEATANFLLHLLYVGLPLKTLPVTSRTPATDGLTQSLQDSWRRARLTEAPEAAAPHLPARPARHRPWMPAAPPRRRSASFSSFRQRPNLVWGPLLLGRQALHHPLGAARHSARPGPAQRRTPFPAVAQDTLSAGSRLLGRVRTFRQGPGSLQKACS